MVRTDYVLAVMAAAQVPLSPVQVQKLFFILDKKAGAQLGGPFFGFRPYSYGPFDADVCHELDELIRRGFVENYGTRLTPRCGITAAGLKLGGIALQSLALREYVNEVADFVRSVSFSVLVAAVHVEWPEMTLPADRLAADARHA